MDVPDDNLAHGILGMARLTMKDPVAKQCWGLGPPVPILSFRPLGGSLCKRLTEDDRRPRLRPRSRGVYRGPLCGATTNAMRELGQYQSCRL